MNHLGKVETQNCIKVNNSKEKAKTGLFGCDPVLEMNTKNLGNSSSFLSITHMTLSAKRFRCYGIWKIDFATEFCFWTEQRLNGTQLLDFGLAETLEVLNTITVGNSLSFLMIHKTAPNGWRFMSYDFWKLDRSAESEFLADYTFWYKSRFL
jgi:hypothetical protein